MPLRTNVGVSRKVSVNSYGSRGASVNLEVELDSSLINDPERFLGRIRQVFRLAQQTIDEELTRQQGNGTANHLPFLRGIDLPVAGAARQLEPRFADRPTEAMQQPVGKINSRGGFQGGPVLGDRNRLRFTTSFIS